MTKIWAVWYTANPHRWSSGNKRLIVAYDTQEAAENFVAIHPQYHYRSGEAEPAMILHVEEVQLNEACEHWNPSFP